MSRLVRLILVALLAIFVYSTGTAVWRASQFDSYFAGYVQNTGGRTETELQSDLIDLAIQHGIEFGENPVEVTPRGEKYDITFSYYIPVGLGGFSYLWEKSISGTTSYGAAVGVPQGIEHIPSSRSHEIRGLRQRPSQVKSRLKDSSH